MFKTTLIYLILLLAVVNSAGAEATKIHFMIEENPPYNFWENRQIQGLAVDLLEAMTSESVYPVKATDIELLPWARGYKIVQTTPDTCLFSMGRTAHREEQFKWVGPITELTVGLVAAKNKNIRIKSFAELESYRIGTIRDGAPEQLLITAGFPVNRLERVTKPEQNIKKLIRNRIDMLAFNADSTWYTMKHMGLNPDDYEMVYPLKTIKLYYAFNKETNDKLIESLNQSLKQLKKANSYGNSLYHDILSPYLNK